MSKVQQFTIRFTVTDMTKCSWLWDSLMKDTEVNGIKASAISNGDLFETERCLEEIIEIHEQNAPFLDTEDEEKIEAIRDRITKAQERHVEVVDEKVEKSV